VLAGALLAAVSGPGPARSESAADWLPLSVGQEQAFRLHWDQTLEREGASPTRSFTMGFARDRVVEQGPSSERAGGPVFRVRMREEVWPLSGGDAERSERTVFQAVGPGGAFLFQPLPDAPAEGFSVSRENPVRVLPAAPVPGASWRAGTIRRDGLRIPLRGEVVGAEDLEVEGRTYDGCLHVRLTGPPEGSVSLGSGSMRVSEGTYEQDTWLARGVGIVLEVRRTDLTLDSKDGGILRSTNVHTRRRIASSPDPEG
jgi:hypothetical protein